MKNEKLAHLFVDPANDEYTNLRSTRRTEITIETREIKTIRMRSMGGTTFCEECGEIASSYGPADVAMFLQIELPDVLRSIDSGRVHLLRGGVGPENVCGNSLEFLVNEIRSAAPDVK